VAEGSKRKYFFYHGLVSPSIDLIQKDLFDSHPETRWFVRDQGVRLPI